MGTEGFGQPEHSPWSTTRTALCGGAAAATRISIGYAAEPDVLIEQFRHDEAIAAAATLRLLSRTS